MLTVPAHWQDPFPPVPLTYTAPRKRRWGRPSNAVDPSSSSSSSISLVFCQAGLFRGFCCSTQGVRYAGWTASQRRIMYLLDPGIRLAFFWTNVQSTQRATGQASGPAGCDSRPIANPARIASPPYLSATSVSQCHPTCTDTSRAFLPGPPPPEVALVEGQQRSSQ
ncbi:uncharacterized protein LY79DRAFT_332410 [Colletotrichum navitas]|uniref:Uncharacterized protein n=1 Tax=Colletotrichum navitas TaxID=681940 RepID=A0AAD8V2L3_9PEZI|nr:uncharacterized protein LY79DRAFT_332410 [Colletotrichum navitas]KAK1579879.1 hypothetical protein LY79DRAFT_332410 [Colletotrichum navitas]